MEDWVSRYLLVERSYCNRILLKGERRTDDYENGDSVRRSSEINGGSDSISTAEESDIHFVFTGK